MVVTISHIISVSYRLFVLRVSLNMFPLVEDLRHLWDDIQYYLGRRKQKAFYGRYSYAEKLEYLAVVWGTLIMGVTGFMMWNPIITARWFPGEFIPAAKAAHGAEAVLAVLAIILWHMYNVHLRHFNTSIFTGKMTEDEMKHEHPAELSAIKSGQIAPPIPKDVLRRRQIMFFPVAAAVAAVLSLGAIAFISIEETATIWVYRGENVPVYAPITPTPTVTPLPTATSFPTATPIPGEVIQANSWEGSIKVVLDTRCSACHGASALGGLNILDYVSTLQGGATGPAIVPGDVDASILIQVQSTGDHPGQLSEDELGLIIDWIEAGAPEK
jgi:cytochrome b subunit of formate dehydrogenase